MLTRPGMGLTLTQAPCSEGLVERVAVAGAVRQQDLAGANLAQHVGGASPVVGLAFGQLQHHRQAVGVGQGVDLGGQPAPRAPHAAGESDVPRGGVLQRHFLTLAAC